MRRMVRLGSGSVNLLEDVSQESERHQRRCDVRYEKGVQLELFVRTLKKVQSQTASQ
jgi:hypothetical protein